MILEKVWGYDFGGEENIVEVYIRSLRDKLNDKDHQLIRVADKGTVLPSVTCYRRKNRPHLSSDEIPKALAASVTNSSVGFPDGGGGRGVAL